MAVPIQPVSPAASPYDASFHPGGVPAESTESAPSSQTCEAAAFIPREDDPDQGLLDAMREAREKIEAHREQLKKLKKTNIRYGDAPMEAYTRLSRAKSPSQASSAAGYARRRLAQLQAAKGQDPDNARQIETAIRQLRKAAARAGKKRLELEREQLEEKRRKKLIKQQQLRKAKRLQLQLKRRQTQRVIRESGYFRELEIENRLQAQLAQTETELREQAQSLAQAYAPSTDAAIQHYSAQAVPSPAPAPEISVQA